MAVVLVTIRQGETWTEGSTSDSKAPNLDDSSSTVNHHRE